MANRPPRTPKRVKELRAKLEERGLLERVEQICREYNVLVEAVLMGRRSTRVVRARDACIARILKVPMSCVEAGEILDMDHTSIICARQRYESRDRGRLLT